MYNNNFSYFPPPSRPRLRRPNPYNWEDQFGDPYFQPHPPMYERFPTRPRHIPPPSDWETQWINRQIDISQDRWLKPYRNDAIPFNRERRMPRPRLMNANVQHARSFCPTRESPVIPDDKIETSVEKTENNIKEIENKVAIPPKVSAKEMWETSYRERVPNDDVSTTEVSRPDPSPIFTANETNGSRKRKAFKNKKGVYFRGKYIRGGKRQKKFDNGTAAASEPGDGFDVNAMSTVETSSNDSERFPKMCKVCNQQLLNETQAENHYKGEVHKENVNQFLSGQNLKSITQKIDKITGSVILPTNTPPCLSWDETGPYTSDRSVNTVRFCSLCSVRMTSLVTAKQHYDGKSHAKRIRMTEKGQKPHRKQFKPTQFVSGGTLGMQEEILTANLPQVNYVPSMYQQQNNMVVKTPKINMKPTMPSEFANSLTPSGQFYCKTCNITIEHVGNLRNHLQSKLHKQAKHGK